MKRRCEVLRTVVELCSELEVSSIPDDFDPGGFYSQAIRRIRQKYTNYETLLQTVPACPAGCQVAVREGGVLGAACTNYELAHDTLTTEARQLALSLYSAWLARKQPPPYGQ